MSSSSSSPPATAHQSMKTQNPGRKKAELTSVLLPESNGQLFENHADLSSVPLVATAATACIASFEFLDIVFFHSRPMVYILFHIVIVSALIVLCAQVWRNSSVWEWRSLGTGGTGTQDDSTAATASVERASWTTLKPQSARLYAMIIVLASLHFTIRCRFTTALLDDKNHDIPVPIMYILMAPCIALQWPGLHNTIPKALTRYSFALIYVWTLVYWNTEDHLRLPTKEHIMIAVPFNCVVIVLAMSRLLVAESRIKVLQDMRHRQNEAFESFLSQMPCLVWIVDRNGVFQWVRETSPGKSKLPGKKMTNLLKEGFHMSPSLAEEINTKHQRVMDEGGQESYIFEGSYDDWSDKKMFYSVRLHPLRNIRSGHIMGVVGVGHDITDNVAMQLRLQHASEEYENLVSCISDTIICLDEALNVKFINSSEFLGMKKEELIGTSLLDLFGGFQEDIKCILEDVLATGNEKSITWWYDTERHHCFTEGRTEASELQSRILDGTLHVYMCSAIRSRAFGKERQELSNELVGSAIILSVRNMTENRKAVEQRRISEEIQITNKSKERFIRSLSHEIRNPLTCICGSLELFEQSTDNLTQLQKELIKDSRASALFLMDILNDVLDAEQIKSGRFTLKETMNCLIDVVESVVTMQVSSSTCRNIEVISFVDPDIPAFLMFDRTRVSQILSNLVSNAIKFTKEGNVYVSALLVEQSEESVIVELRCEDTGVGISKDDLQNIFQPFMQFETTSRPAEFRGFGLGLGIVQNLLNAMGGTIDVESESGSGSVFKVRLPIQKMKGSSGSSSSDTQIAEPISKLLVPSRFDYILTVTQSSRLCSILKRYLTALDVQNVDCIEHYMGTAFCRERQASSSDDDGDTRELIETVKNAIHSIREQQSQHTNVRPHKSTRIVVIIDYPGPQIVDIANALQSLNVLCILLLHRDSVITHGNYHGPHRVIKKPVCLFKLMHALSNVETQDGGLSPLDVDAVHAKTNFFDWLTIAPSVAMGITELDSNVMVVEDNAVVAKILVKYLQKIGCKKIIVANNGLEAVEKIRESEQHDITCVLMDLQMPVMNGFQATKAIRAMNDRYKREIPIIAVTANSDQDSFDGCQAAGFDDVLQKPCTIAKICEAMERVIGRRMMERVGSRIATDRI